MKSRQKQEIYFSSFSNLILFPILLYYLSLNNLNIKQLVIDRPKIGSTNQFHVHVSNFTFLSFSLHLHLHWGQKFLPNTWCLHFVSSQNLFLFTFFLHFFFFFFSQCLTSKYQHFSFFILHHYHSHLIVI